MRLVFKLLVKGFILIHSNTLSRKSKSSQYLLYIGQILVRWQNILMEFVSNIRVLNIDGILSKIYRNQQSKYWNNSGILWEKTPM